MATILHFIVYFFFKVPFCQNIHLYGPIKRRYGLFRVHKDKTGHLEGREDGLYVREFLSDSDVKETQFYCQSPEKTEPSVLFGEGKRAMMWNKCPRARDHKHTIPQEIQRQ